MTDDTFVAANSVLERLSRTLLWVSAGALALVGILSFLFSTWAATEFPWKVGPFLAMTIGGWAIGQATFAFEAARLWRTERAIAAITSAWLFGFGELIVVVLFLGRLRLGLLAWPHLVGLVALTASAVAGVAWLIRDHPPLRSASGRLPTALRVVVAVFAILVLLLALGTAVAGDGGSITQGTVFPEPFSLFSARAFSAFFVSLAAGAGSLLLVRSVAPVLEYARAGLVGLVAITVAAASNLGLFDFSGRPLGLVYLGAYVVVGVGAAALLRYHRR